MIVCERAVDEDKWSCSRDTVHEPLLPGELWVFRHMDYIAPTLLYIATAENGRLARLILPDHHRTELTIRSSQDVNDLAHLIPLKWHPLDAEDATGTDL